MVIDQSPMKMIFLVIKAIIFPSHVEVGLCDLFACGNREKATALLQYLQLQIVWLGIKAVWTDFTDSEYFNV